MDDELVRKAMLLQISGRYSDEALIEFLGIDASQIDEVRAAVTARSLAMSEEVLRPEPRPKADQPYTRDEAIHALLQSGWMNVERHIDPEAIADPEDHGDFIVDYNDNIAHNFEASVEASVEVVRAFPGVTQARHEDRELILGWGHVNLGELEARLRSWWTDRLLDDPA